MALCELRSFHIYDDSIHTNSALGYQMGLEDTIPRHNLATKKIHRTVTIKLIAQSRYSISDTYV